VRYPYAALAVNDDAAAVAMPASQRNFLLPFGFHERIILDNVLDYGWRLYPWMSVLAAFGLVLALAERGEQRKLWRILVVFTFLLAAWLGVVYGSWKIVDNPDPSIISLGNSHVRYWLPVFALASIFGARTLVFLLGDGSRLRQVYVGGLIALTALLSGQLVAFGHDGYVPSRAALATFAAKEARILALTEAQAIIVVDRADKYLFPERRVVVPLRSETTYAALATMLEHAPVYYFGITLPPGDMDYLNQEKLQGVSIQFVDTLHEESLYRFVVE
jgi:hypothetical protein